MLKNQLECVQLFSTDIFLYERADIGPHSKHEIYNIPNERRVIWNRAERKINHSQSTVCRFLYL